MTIDLRHIAYNAAAMPLLGVYLLARLARGKSREGWAERWGGLPADFPQKRGVRVWFHAASVGEVVAATPILTAYRARNPEHQLVLSVVTPGGHEVAQRLVGQILEAVFYCPFDVPRTVRRVVNAVQPSVFVALETELWPNLLHEVKRSGARAILVNGRISDRSVAAYRRLSAIFGWTVRQFDRIMAQSERDAARLIEIGADSEAVAVSGNAKFDQIVDPMTAEQAAALRRELHLDADAPVLVVGSTRSAAEEEKVLEAYGKAREAIPNLALVHAPRHVDRADDVMAAMRVAGLNPVRRTEIATATTCTEQIVLDTFGELARVYGVADVAFVGNSLVPPGGGQNVLQPLAHGKPAIYGAYMANFRDLCALAEEAEVGFRVGDERELADQIVSLVSDAGARRAIRDRATALVSANRGAAARYAEAITELARHRDALPPASRRERVTA